jgi:hypothetical protein
MMRIFLTVTAISLLGVAAAPSFAGDDVNNKGTSLTLDPGTKPKPSTGGGGQGFQQTINPSTNGLQSFQSTKSNTQNSGGQSPKTK